MILKFGAHELTIDDSLISPQEVVTMKTETSYLDRVIDRLKSREYREKLLPLKIQCLENIKKKIQGQYESYLDIMAGIGISPKIFGLPSNSIYNDLCEKCYRILKDNFPLAEITSDDMFDGVGGEHDFIFADFNNFTLNRFNTLYRKITDSLFLHSKKYLLINDCSRFYLRYGKRAFENYSKALGEEVIDLDGFYSALKKYYEKIYPEWSLIAIEAFRDTSFLLFSKGSGQPVEFNLNDQGTLSLSINLIKS